MSVQGVTLQNGPQFHLSFTRCVDVKANFLRVMAPADSPNTDGIHLNDSSRVQIMDNLISTGTLSPCSAELSSFRVRLRRLNIIRAETPPGSAVPAKPCLHFILLRDKIKAGGHWLNLDRI